MKAVVFAAGLGTRLKPFTDFHPKALAPVGATTALGVVLNRLSMAGADGIVVNVHHFAGQVIDWIAEQHYDFEVEISDESDLLLDTGGALAKIYRESHIVASMADDEPLLIHNADIITDFSIQEMISASKGADGAILADPQRSTSRKFLFDSNLWLRGWCNNTTGLCRPGNLDKSRLEEAAFDGVHCLYRPILARISDYCGDLHPFSIVDFYIYQCTSGDKVRRFTPSKPFGWYDIGNPERLAKAQQAYENGLLQL